jgi:hypothetical protein
MVPYKAKIEKEDTDPLYIIRGFGVGYVWDVLQTEGRPLPDPPAVKPGGESEEAVLILTRLTRFATEAGVTIVRDFTGNQRGYWHPARREIGIRSDLTGISEVKTTCHEVAHFLADHRATVDRADAEDVAESAAYVTLMHMGIDTSGYSFGYIAGWAKDMAVFRRNLSEVQKISHQMIGIIEGEPVSNEEGRTNRSTSPECASMVSATLRSLRDCANDPNDLWYVSLMGGEQTCSPLLSTNNIDKSY